MGTNPLQLAFLYSFYSPVGAIRYGFYRAVEDTVTVYRNRIYRGFVL